MTTTIAKPVARPRTAPGRKREHRSSARPAYSQRKRLIAIMAFLLVLIVVAAGRLVYIQLVAGPRLAEQALDGRLRTTTLPASRGEIVDSTGTVMAYSVQSYTIVANQRLIAAWSAKDEAGNITASGPAGAARLLAPLLGWSVPELAAKLLGDDQYVVLNKKVTPATWEQIQDLGITGISAEMLAERIYPSGNTGGNVLGFVSAAGEGQAGIELAYDSFLGGTNGTLQYQVSAGSNPVAIPGTQEVTAAAVSGGTVHLTINQDIQWMVQQALDAQVAATGSSEGMVVMMIPSTGEIIALADSTTVDPNNPGGVDATDRGARTISDVFDPGSTAKVVTMAAILEEGIADPLSQYEVPDTYTTPNGQVFHDSHEHPVENLTLNGILAQSSNVGTVMVGQGLTKQQRYDYLSAFGFGQATGIELPGESAGIMASADSWDGRTQYGVMFGQGLSATALQAASVYATVANGGVKVEPHIVAGTTDANGVYTVAEAPATSQVISPETAHTLLQMLESAVTADGTGIAAAIDGYRVAGKTGTSQVITPSGTSIMASFIGVAPADHPAIVTAVFLKDPPAIWGGVVAAPLYQKITAYALAKLGITPSSEEPELYPINW